MPPIQIDVNPNRVKVIMCCSDTRNIMINKGGSFCQVESRMHINQLMPLITCGNQKCMGAIPNLIIKPKIINKYDVEGINKDKGL